MVLENDRIRRKATWKNDYKDDSDVCDNSDNHDDGDDGTVSRDAPDEGESDSEIGERDQIKSSRKKVSEFLV